MARIHLNFDKSLITVMDMQKIYCFSRILAIFVHNQAAIILAIKYELRANYRAGFVHIK
jgi:hypothetical protein